MPHVQQAAPGDVTRARSVEHPLSSSYAQVIGISGSISFEKKIPVRTSDPSQLEEKDYVKL